MIVATIDGRLRCVTQSDHARFAAQLLELWRAPAVAEHPRRPGLVQATREHDVGWQGADAAPMVDSETGRPHDFRSLPEDHRLDLWRRGTRRWIGRDSYTALLVLEHAIALHRERSGEAWAETIAAWCDERDAELEATGLSREELESDYGWLELADSISLQVAMGTNGSTLVRGYRAELCSAGLEIEPFPLAGATSFDVPCRWIDDRRYERDSELAVELATARWTSFTVRVAPPSDG